MQTPSLLYGLIGFFIGGLLVSLAMTTFNKPTTDMSTMSMEAMTADLDHKTGDDYDKAFIANMIAHHEGAVAMAELSKNNAKHQEIKTLSTDIIAAQQKEIASMKRWQAAWGYDAQMNHSH